MKKAIKTSLITLVLATLATPALAARDDAATALAVKGYFKAGQSQIKQENRDHLRANLLVNQQAMLKQNSQLTLAQNRAGLDETSSANLAP